MDRILEELNKTPGVIGSFVVDKDGIIVASDFMMETNDEVMGALASSIIHSSTRVVQKLGQGDIRSFFLETDKNKIFFHVTNPGYLVCVTNPEANIGLIRVEMRLGAQKIDSSEE